ncbi:MAG TPA: phage tail tip lysozyme [Candidatus Saccharimonadales bacterium]|nr:phage tail tip lysozyme [Candidatus Saccharimonadales bacterium]
MSEEEETSGGGGVAFLCTVVVLALAGALFWATNHFDEGKNLPWRFDLSNLAVATDAGPADIQEADPPAPAHPAQNATEREKVKNEVWKFLRANGLSREQAAGVMGNIQAESHFDPKIVEYGSGIGYGLCQWSRGRRTALEQSVPKGKKVSDLDYQLDYMYREMHVRKPHLAEYSRFPNEWAMMLKQGSLEDAVVAFHNEFERSNLMNLGSSRAIRQAVLNQRLGLARESYNNPSRFP